MNTITVDSLSLSLSGLPILKEISFTIEEGHIVGLLGSNGSGKTTLVKTMLGLHKHQRGRIEILGTPLSRFRHWDRIGYVPQRASVCLHSTTVSEVVASGTLAHRLIGWPRSSDRKRVMEALEMVDLADQAKETYLHLSGGQQQRVLIARGIVNRPAVIFMDEPFAGVDLTNQTTIAEALRGFAATIIVALHETSALSGILDRTLILREGRLIYDGPPSYDGGCGPHPVEPPDRTHLLTGMEQTWSF